MAQLLKGPFTVADYHRMVECGILRDDDPVELLEGQVIVMSPIGIRHAAAVDALNQALVLAFRGVATVRVQGPIVLDNGAEPEPDVTVFVARPQATPPTHPLPGDILLLVEVADTSLPYDRDIKIPLYARAGIPEVWLVNLHDDIVEVRRHPSGLGYQHVHTARRDDTLTPQTLAALRLPVTEILGPAQ